MSAVKRFLLVELVSIVTLVMVAGAVAAFGAIDSVSHANSLISPGGSAWIGFGYTAIIGLLPVVIVGAPIYFMLVRRNMANWLNVVILGAAPGVLLLFISLALGVWAIACGVVVASVTHVVCTRLVA